MALLKKGRINLNEPIRPKDFSVAPGTPPSEARQRCFRAELGILILIDAEQARLIADQSSRFHRIVDERLRLRICPNP